VPEVVTRWLLHYVTLQKVPEVVTRWFLHYVTLQKSAWSCNLKLKLKFLLDGYFSTSYYHNVRLKWYSWVFICVVPFQNLTGYRLFWLTFLCLSSSLQTNMATILTCLKLCRGHFLPLLLQFSVSCTPAIRCSIISVFNNIFTRPATKQY
jgi:hypothetical protein